MTSSTKTYFRRLVSIKVTFQVCLFKDNTLLCINSHPYSFLNCLFNAFGKLL